MRDVSADNIWEAFVAFCRLSATAELQEQELLPGRLRLAAGVRKAQPGCFGFSGKTAIAAGVGRRRSGLQIEQTTTSLQALTQRQQANNKHAEERSRCRVHCSLVALTVEAGMSMLLLVVIVLA
jgi:hypothetical protein